MRLGEEGLAGPEEADWWAGRWEEEKPPRPVDWRRRRLPLPQVVVFGEGKEAEGQRRLPLKEKPLGVAVSLGRQAGQRLEGWVPKYVFYLWEGSAFPSLPSLYGGGWALPGSPSFPETPHLASW